jgi:hypothetical protein
MERCVKGIIASTLTSCRWSSFSSSWIVKISWSLAAEYETASVVPPPKWMIAIGRASLSGGVE